MFGNSTINFTKKLNLGIQIKRSYLNEKYNLEH